MASKITAISTVGEQFVQANKRENIKDSVECNVSILLQWSPL